jgi:Flp pilus assembly protein TadD
MIVLLGAVLAIECRANNALPGPPQVPVYAPAEMPPAGWLDPLVVTPEMRAWLDREVPRLGTEDDRMRRLVTALSTALPLQYDAPTGTAEDVFGGGRYNCLGLAHLLVAFGRELGVDAYYVRIEEFPTYQPDGSLILTSTHVAAGWGPSTHVQIVDIGQATERERRAAYRITDGEALALHYNNKGAELLVTGQVGLAREWLDRGLTLDPGMAEGWVNQGVALRRSGDPDGAEAAYRKAIEVDVRDLAAWRNLASLMAQRGDPHTARDLLALATRWTDGDPFVWLALGDLTVAAGLTDDASRFYRHAARLDPGNPQILAARAELAFLRGDAERAAVLAARSLVRGPDDPRAAAVAAKVLSAGR